MRVFLPILSGSCIKLETIVVSMLNGRLRPLLVLRGEMTVRVVLPFPNHKMSGEAYWVLCIGPEQLKY